MFKYSVIHLLPEKKCSIWQESDKEILAVCGNNLRESSCQGGEDNYLTLTEYLTKESKEGIPAVDPLNEEDLKEFMEHLCPACKNHEDLPLLALVEIT